MIQQRVLLYLLLLSTIACNSNQQTQNFIVGTYTNQDSYGVYTLGLNEKNGRLFLRDSIRSSNPSFLIYEEKNNKVYAVNESSFESAQVEAFTYHSANGSLKKNDSILTRGSDPCHLCLLNNNLFASNYSSGSLTQIPLNEKGLFIGEAYLTTFSGSGLHPQRQKQSHIHSATAIPQTNSILVCDLGTDSIHSLFIDSANNLTSYASFATEQGSGPRHLVFSPNAENHLYGINELNGKVVFYKQNGGILTSHQELIADTLQAAGSAAIKVSPKGDFLYCSNRLKGDGIAIFSIDKNTGSLTKVGYQLTGKHPRDFSITPSGKFLLVACRDDNRIEVYRRDKRKGTLTLVSKQRISMPTCICFVP